MSAHALLAARQLIGSVVRFEREVIRDETAFEPDMLALLVEARMLDSDFFHMRFETRCFEAHNDPLLDPNYYDRAGNPCLTAREAGFWEEINDYYMGGPADWAARFTPIGVVARPVHKIRRADYQVVGWFETDTAFYTYKTAPIDADTVREVMAISRSTSLLMRQEKVFS